MKKYVNINIQRFGHTNSTSNYEFPQFIGTDKPQWLTDINQAFASIDTAIHTVSVLANLNSTKIGDLTELTTDDKLNLVDAINEVDSHTDSNTNTIAGHTTAIGNNTTAIGNLINLNTVDKTNLVSAINEVDLLAKNNENKIGTLSDLDTDAKSSVVAAVNEVKGQFNLFNLVNHNTCTVLINGGTITEGTVECDTNSDGSLFRLYGQFIMNATSWTNVTITISNTGLPTISEPYTIDGAGFRELLVNENNNLRSITLTVNTNGSITISFGMESAVAARVLLFNGLYFNANFGDTPSA